MSTLQKTLNWKVNKNPSKAYSQTKQAHYLLQNDTNGLFVANGPIVTGKRSDASNEDIDMYWHTRNIFPNRDEISAGGVVYTSNMPLPNCETGAKEEEKKVNVLTLRRKITVKKWQRNTAIIGDSIIKTINGKHLASKFTLNHLTGKDRGYATSCYPFDEL